MAKETREQRQQRLLQSKLARQAREQEIIEGLPTLGAQAGWMAGLMLPSSGGTDYFGMYPEMPTEEQMIPTERLPSFSENIANKRYMDAMYQTLGVLGDAAYASAPFTGPAGLIAGTALKGTGAIGKVSKASKAKGIASLQEKSDLAKAVKQKQKEAMERHANNYSDSLIANPSGELDYSSREIPFVSPTLEALIKRAPKNLKGKQVMEWVNANANKGVKPKEVEYLGIDEFIANNPNATVDEVIEGISENKISIQKSIYKTSDDSPVLEFIESNPNTDPLDGSNFWQYRTDEILNDLDVPVADGKTMIPEYKLNAQDRARQELLEHYNKKYRLGEHPVNRDVEKKSWDEIPETMHEDIADSLARQEYRDNPYEMIEVANDLGQNPNNTFALGNEDIGYQIFVDGERYTAGRDVPYSNTEAKIQLRSAISDVGHDYLRLEGEVDDYGATQFKDYIDNNLPGGDNYREVSFNWENAPKGHSHADHIQEDNQIAHALIRDRKLADGTDSLHIDELQSDLHKYGSRHGYELTPKQREQSINKINDSLKDTPYSFEQTGTMTGIKKPNPNVETTFVEGHDFVDDNQIKSAVHDIERAIDGTDTWVLNELMDESGNFKSQDQINKFFNERLQNPKAVNVLGEVDYYNNHKDAFDLIRDLGLDKTKKLIKKLEPFKGEVPDYPFKDDWYNMGIKSLLMDAIEDGKDAISISTSAAMKNRYSDQYHKFYETLYDKKIPSAMQKLAKKYGGKFERGSLDLDNTFGYPAGEAITTGDRNLPIVYNSGQLENAKANTIKITPEMREKVLKEGVHTFASGGVIGNLPSRLAKI